MTTTRNAVDSIVQLQAAIDTLNAALNQGHAAGISAATHMVEQACDAAQRDTAALAVWRDDGRLAAQVRKLARDIDTSRQRVNFMADHARQRVDWLTRIGAGAAPQLYRPAR